MKKFIAASLVFVVIVCVAATYPNKFVTNANPESIAWTNTAGYWGDGSHLTGISGGSSSNKIDNNAGSGTNNILVNPVLRDSEYNQTFYSQSSPTSGLVQLKVNGHNAFAANDNGGAAGSYLRLYKPLNGGVFFEFTNNVGLVIHTNIIAGGWNGAGQFIGNGVGITNIPVAGIAASGISSSKYLKGDGTWAIPGGGGGGDLYSTNNLSDVASPATARTNLGANNGANLTAGTVATARLGSGTANSTTYLRGDNTWATPSGGGSQTPWTTDIDAAGFSLNKLLQIKGNNLSSAADDLALSTWGGESSIQFLRSLGSIDFHASGGGTFVFEGGDVLMNNNASVLGTLTAENFVVNLSSTFTGAMSVSNNVSIDSAHGLTAPGTSTFGTVATTSITGPYTNLSGYWDAAGTFVGTNSLTLASVSIADLAATNLYVPVTNNYVYADASGRLVGSNVVAGANGFASLGYINVQDYGADPTGVADSTSALQSAHEYAKTTNVTVYYPPGTYKTTGTITNYGSLNASDNATISVQANVTGMRVGLVSNTITRKVMVFPNIQKLTVDWSTNGTANGNVGLHLLALDTCRISIGKIINFSIGIEATGTTNNGFQYNTIAIGYLGDNFTNLLLNANASGWVNENTWNGGRLFYSSSLGSNTTGVVHIASIYSINPPNDNRFIGVSMENLAPQYFVWWQGRNNYWDRCRFEPGGSSPPQPKIVFDGGQTKYNIINNGFNGSDVRMTEQNGAIRDTVWAYDNAIPYGGLYVSGPSYFTNGLYISQTNGGVSQINIGTTNAIEQFYGGTKYSWITTNGIINGNAVGLTNYVVTRFHGFNLSPAFNTTTRYYVFEGGPTGGQTTENIIAQPILGGYLTNLFVNVQGVAIGTNVVFTVMTNGVASSITVNMNGNGGVTNANDTTHREYVTNGTLISMKIVGNNVTASAANTSAGWVLSEHR